MAKAGEGDPRWIVEERADGTNADNWHWTEKKATSWSNDTLKALLPNLAFEDADGNTAETGEVETITGDVIANCRKGKLIFFYELVVKLKWKGRTKGGDGVSGTLHISNLSEEQDMDDIEVNVALSGAETADKRKVKELMRKKGADLIRQQLAKWLKRLKEEYALDLVKPTDRTASSSAAVPAVTGGVSGPAKVGASAAGQGADKPDTVVETKKADAGGYVGFRLADEFKCSPADLFAAICTEERVRAYTQSECKINPKVGGEFSMFSGNVCGVFQQLEPGKLVKQAWRFKHWPAGHFSTVTLTIKDLGDKCRLELQQDNVPKSDAESTKAGWQSNQWQRMKAILGFGSGLGLSF